MLPFYCPSIPDLEHGQPHPTPDKGLTNFVTWKLKCFYKWLWENQRLTEPFGIDDPSPFIMTGEIYNLKTKLSKVSGSGIYEWFKHRPNPSSVSGNLNGGNFRVYFENDINPITSSGQFESVGAVLDILPFAANGSATWSGTSRLRFDASFHVQNGIISLKREDCRTSFDLTKQTNLT
ncbi:hypothetical protein Fcan01_17988, partial [Folsomia candida]